MRLSIAFLAMVLLCSFVPAWETDFASAKLKAQQENKYILLNFSGSDWCGPCIRLRAEIFDSAPFKKFAETNLVLLNDFPRQKKNQLPKDQQKKNDQLADAYNSAGSFPYTVLLNADGKVLKSWDGFPKENTEAFIEEINQAIHAQH